MKEFYTKYKNIIDKILKYILVFVILFVFVRYALKYIAPFITAFIISLILEPFVSLLCKKVKFSRGLSAGISIVVVLTLIITIGTSVVYKLGSEIKNLVTNIPLYEEQIIQTYQNIKERAENIFYLIPEEIQSTIGQVMDTLINSITQLIGSGVKTGSLNIVVKFPTAFMFILITIISTFFFIKDKYEIEAYLVKKIPTVCMTKINKMKSHVLSALAGYFRAQGILMCCVCIICIIVLTIIGSPYALLMGILISIIDALPVFGSGFILWPWAAWSLISGNYKFAIGLAVNYFIVLLTRQMLEPKIVGEQIGIHPLITLFSIYVGMKVFGIFGFIIGPIVAVLIKAMTAIEKKI